ncbi:MAG: hypothetical protein FJ271_00250 [Planctomycetes bacterium]|nr:hypothetical protein [Planctomycetota bacterium]
MFARLVIVCGCLGLFAMAGSAQDDQAELRKLVDRAIKAQGGAEVLGKFKATKVKFKGKFYGMGEGIEYTGDMAYDLPDKFRFEIGMDIMGMKISIVQVSNGKKGWAKIINDVKELDKEQQAEVEQGLHVIRASHLIDLKGKDFKLSPLGESKVEGKAVIGVRVSSKGRRDVNLFFGKDDALLRKIETVVKDSMAGGQEFSQETIYDNYKQVQGKFVPMKLAIRRDGKLFVDGETTSVEHAEKLDDAVFGRP